MTGQEAFHLPGVVQSVVESQTNGPLIAVAAQLWLRPDDLVVDVTYGRGKFWTHHRFVVSTALDLGLRQVDEFIHYSGLGPQPLRDVQEHSRRAHSFLCIFRVPKRRARRLPALETP